MKHCILAKYRAEVYPRRDALPLYDGSAPHHLWKEEFGPLLAQKAIFDFEA